MPPLNWCGKSRRRRSGSDIPTIVRSSTARARASFLVTFLWALMVSTICSSMVRTGFRLVMGSWKIIAISLPRSSRISASSRPIRSSPSNKTWPPSIRPAGAGSSRITARFVTLLPQPDSPTRPSVSPSSRSKETPFTAWTVPSWVRNRTIRSRTDRRATPLPLQARVESLAQAVAQEIEADGAEDDNRAREEDEVRSRLQEATRVGQHLAPLGDPGVARAEPQEAQPGHVDDGRGRSQSRLHDQWRQRVRQHMADQNPDRRGAHGPGGNHVVRLSNSKQATPQQASKHGRVGDAHCQHDLDLPMAQPGHEADGQQYSGHGQQDVDHTHEDAVHDPTRAARDSPHDGAADQPEHHGDDADGEADPGTVEDTAELVHPLLVRAHDVCEAGPL